MAGALSEMKGVNAVLTSDTSGSDEGWPAQTMIGPANGAC